MKLQLQTELQSTVQDPLRQCAQCHASEYGTDQHGESPIQAMSPHGFRHPFEVAPTGDYELDLVGRFESLEVGPAIGFTFAAIRAFQVHDDVDAWIDRSDIVSAAGLQQHCPSRIGNASHERQHIGLKQRLAAGDFDERAVVRK